jgi:hypothetical protein
MASGLIWFMPGLFAIHIGNHLVALSVAGAILAVWR